MKSSDNVVCLIALIVWLVFVGTMAVMISAWCLLVLLLGFKCKKKDEEKEEK